MVLDHFSLDEFDCKCGSCGYVGADMTDESLEMLDKARDLAGVPFKVNRGISCPTHNAMIGGSETSSHLPDRACAFDIAAEHSSDRYRIVEGAIAAGFRRIGIGRTFIHMDTDDTKSDQLIWLYS